MCLCSHNSTPCTCPPKPTTKSLDWSKPIQTRDGRPARLVCSDYKSSLGPRYSHFVLVTQRGIEVATVVTVEGRSALGPRDSASDVVNVPTKRTGWVNIYPTMLAAIHNSKEEAEAKAQRGRVACVKIEWEE